MRVTGQIYSDSEAMSTGWEPNAKNGVCLQKGSVCTRALTVQNPQSKFSAKGGYASGAQNACGTDDRARTYDPQIHNLVL